MKKVRSPLQAAQPVSSEPESALGVCIRAVRTSLSLPVSAELECRWGTCSGQRWGSACAAPAHSSGSQDALGTGHVQVKLHRQPASPGGGRASADLQSAFVGLSSQLHSSACLSWGGTSPPPDLAQ